MIKIVLLLILSLCLRSPSFAGEVSMEDKVIGSTFKALAKMFVVIVDIKKLKEDNIAKLNKMDEEKFKREYAEVYEAIKYSPPNLKSNYGITKHMSRQQAIKIIESLDKKEIYAIIDTIPDTIIAHQFRRYLKQKKQQVQKSNIVEQISKLWTKMTEKTEIK